MASYQEIVTKAIVGKGKKKFKNTYEASTEFKPTTVLGCWVINNKFKGYKAGTKVKVNGSFDINIWYSYENDSKTAVISKKINYDENINVHMKDNITLDDTDIIVRSLQNPTCNNISIKENGISFDIEKEIGVEVVGDTKVKIAAIKDEDNWDDISDEEIDNINEDYLSTKNS